MKKLANEAQTPVTEKTDLKAQLAEVAERIRTMREIIGLSEEEMAQRTGVTLEEYRGFESGEHDFSFTFIFKCAERFGIDPTDLIKGTSPRLSTYTVTRRGEGLPITRRQGFKYLNLAPLFKGKTAEPFFVTMVPTPDRWLWLDNGLYPRARQNNGRVCLSVQWLREQWSEVNHGCG